MDVSNVHILLCDHDLTAGSETHSLLKKCTYKVTAVKTVRQAVNVLESEGSKVDVVLTDVEEPKEKGLHVLKYVLKRNDLGHIAVVVMSAHDEMAVVAKCLSLGAVDYLVKPLRLNEVMNLWTHMWRNRRVMKLPEKPVGITTTNPAKTADLLSVRRNSESSVPATGASQRAQLKEASGPQVELCLRLSLNHNSGKVPASLPSQPFVGGTGKLSAFSTYLRSCARQPNEQSGTNACSSSSSPSKRSKKSSECITIGNQESVSGLLADASTGSPKDYSVADETKPVDVESQRCYRSNQLLMEQAPPQSIFADECLLHAGRTSPAYVQGFRPFYTFMGLPPSNVRQVQTVNVPEVPTPRSNLALNPPPGQPVPVYYHESGMATTPPVPNLFSCYPVTHLAVPVGNFSTWPTIVSPHSLVGANLIQAERREAALSKFRMKRNERCFEKKIRYVSRKRLAEQRPRVRGQFVKRIVLAENIDTQVVSDDEEGDDEQGRSGLDM